MRKIRVLIHVTEHDDGARFYEWEVRGVKKEEAQRVLADLGLDLRTSPLMVLKEDRGPKEE